MRWIKTLLLSFVFSSIVLSHGTVNATEPTPQALAEMLLDESGAAPKGGSIPGGFTPSLAVMPSNKFASPFFVLKKPVACMSGSPPPVFFFKSSGTGG